MKRDEIYKNIRYAVEEYYKFNVRRDNVSYWLIILRDFHNSAIKVASANNNSLGVVLMKALIACVLCIQQNGGVKRGIGPLVERIKSRKGYTDIRFILKLIDGECKYQDNLSFSQTDKSEKDVYCYLIMYDSYLRAAFDARTYAASSYAALDEVRKLAATLVCCFENTQILIKEH